MFNAAADMQIDYAHVSEIKEMLGCKQTAQTEYSQT